MTSPTRQERNVGSRPLSGFSPTHQNKLDSQTSRFKKAVFVCSQQASAVILTCPPRVQHSTKEDNEFITDQRKYLTHSSKKRVFLVVYRSRRITSESRDVRT